MRSWGSPWGSGHGTSFGGGGSSLLDNYWSERWRLRREMVEREPVTELGAFSSDGAVATEWAKALVDLQDAEVYLRFVRQIDRLAQLARRLSAADKDE